MTIDLARGGLIVVQTLANARCDGKFGADSEAFGGKMENRK